MSNQKRQPTRTDGNVDHANHRHGHYGAAPSSKSSSRMNRNSTKRSFRARRTGATAAKWLALGVGVPTLAFFITVHAPSVSHALENPTRAVATPEASDASTAALRPASLTTDQALPVPSEVGALPQGSSVLANPDAPLTVQVFPAGPVPITAVLGGTAGSRRSALREGVADFVREAGATAGLNGTFFANASLTGTDNLLIGPSLCDNDQRMIGSPFDRKPQLAGRPMVLLSDKCTVIVPYQAGVTDNEDTLRTYLPDMKDAFLGGVWLVHNGVAADRDVIDSYNIKDAMDPRRRAFFAVMRDGRPMLGASSDVATSRQLARALAGAGVQEAVLLDSGFSTSLVFQDKILVTGHSSPGIPSRPVPQALVLYGSPDQASLKLTESIVPSVAPPMAPGLPGAPEYRHHRRRRELS